MKITTEYPVTHNAVIQQRNTQSVSQRDTYTHVYGT